MGKPVIPKVSPNTFHKNATDALQSVLKSDGTVVAWEPRPNYGPGRIEWCWSLSRRREPSGARRRHGRGLATTEPVPGGLNGVVAIAAGSAHNLALKADGTVGPGIQLRRGHGAGRIE
jgi:hypothetical protein